MAGTFQFARSVLVATLILSTDSRDDVFMRQVACCILHAYFELLTAADRQFTARNGEPGTAFGRVLAGAIKK